MKIKSKLTLGFLACGLIPLAIAAVSSHFGINSGMTTLQEKATEDIEHKVVASLEAQQSLKKAQILEKIQFILLRGE